jgi:hypothetical protein
MRPDFGRRVKTALLVVIGIAALAQSAATHWLARRKVSRAVSLCVAKKAYGASSMRGSAR